MARDHISLLVEKYCNSAEYHIKRSELSISENIQTSNWKSLHTSLRNTYAKELIQNVNCENTEPEKKKIRTQKNIFHIFCSTEKDLKRMIVNLFPYANGYSVMLQDSNGLYVETMQMSYKEYEFLDYIDNEQIPPMLIKLLDNWEINLFYSGCVIAEIHDYRIAADLSDFDTFFVLLQPTQQTFLDDVNEIASRSSNMLTWSNDDKLLLESYLLVGTSEPLCLDPSPTVSFVKNLMQCKKNSFQTSPFKRHMKRNCANVLQRKVEKRLQTAPPSLELHDFIQKYRSTKKKEKDNTTTDIRLSKDVIDLWRKTPLNLAYPTKEIDVSNYSKAISPKPHSILDSDLLEIQQVHLKSDGLNRDVYSLISILQRPSDMHYFGKLQSNKYFQQASIRDKEFANSCRFSLGTEKQANLYILQYQELFAEDGRRPATVKVNRPLQPTSTKYQIPLLQQPWQLEQEQSLYSVGSVNNIPVKHWSKLKVNQENIVALQLQQTITTLQQQQQQQQVKQQQQAQQQQQQSVNSHHSSTTPTLNAITLQPTSQSSSAFTFPIPQQLSQRQGSVPPPSPQLLQSIQPMQAGRILQQRLSSTDADTLSLISNQDGSLYHLSESANIQLSGRRSRQGSHIFTLSQPGNNGNPSISPRVTPVPQDDGTHTISIINKDGNSNQDRPLNILPLVTLPNQQQTNIQVQQKSHVLSNMGQNIRLASQKQSGGMVIRMPVSINNPQTSSNRQITATFNLLGNGRNVIQSQGPILGNFQQIQLTSGGRVTIPTNQIPAGIAMQLAAAANQLPNDKSGNGHQQFSISNAGITSSTPITIVSNNNQNTALQNKLIRSQQQQQQTSVVRVQHQQFKNIKQQQSNIGATITLNPSTQILTTNVVGAQDQQPLQLLQVGSKTMQQVPIRPQIVLNTSVPQQFQEVQTANTFPSTSSSKPIGRNRKRKSTSDQQPK